MTETEREALVRETVKQCAEIVRDTPIVVHSRGVNGRATLEQAMYRVLRQIMPQEQAEPTVPRNFAEMQRAHIPRPPKP